MTYKFVGSSESQILSIVDGRVVGEVVLSDYGQAIELDDAAALNAIAGGAAVVPANQFLENDQAAMRKLSAETIYTVRETGALPVEQTQPGKKVIDVDGE